jgi:hypothetical protein
VALFIPFGVAFMELHAMILFPERWDEGVIDNSGILILTGAAIIAVSLSAWGAFAAGSKMYSRAHTKAVATMFALAMTACIGVLTYIGVSTGATTMALLANTLIFVVPALVVIYLARLENDV